MRYISKERRREGEKERRREGEKERRREGEKERRREGEKERREQQRYILIKYDVPHARIMKKNSNTSQPNCPTE